MGVCVGALQRRTRHGTRPTPSRGKTPPGPGAGGPRPLPVSPVDLRAIRVWSVQSVWGERVGAGAHLAAGTRRMEAFATNPAGLGCMAGHKPRQTGAGQLPLPSHWQALDELPPLAVAFVALQGRSLFAHAKDVLRMSGGNVGSYCRHFRGRFRCIVVAGPPGAFRGFTFLTASSTV